MKTINFGIDLGTTNSLIAKYHAGNVEVFKNPVGFKETLPSCIAFRGERTLIGDKAREWLLKDALNVFAGFKRKMGTSDNYFCPTKGDFFSPVQLSSMVLSELKNFVHTQEKPEHVVITIPASFDTVQSNATKKAGYDAGFKEVVLLQEPIAASLAFFNKLNDADLQKGKWLVYDLGGGTFDVALIGITETEMRVIDHQGDNYLGGLDFDHSIVMDIILPKLIKKTGVADLAEELNKRQGKYEKLYYILLLKAEEAKKELSNSEIVEIEFSFDLHGNGDEDYFIELTRGELNDCIKPRVESTLEMINLVLCRNSVVPADITEIIMIGGSTYIPYVRESIFNTTGIKVNCTADPTTAVAVGAAYYAGSKASRVEEVKKETEGTGPMLNKATAISLQLSYNKTTKDTEEYITANVHNFSDGLQFRITRTDGGFDTGIKPLKSKIGEFVTLRTNGLNEFKIRIFDGQMNEIPFIAEPIEITHGLFNLFGQPLPEDISIEVDDVDNNTTKCQLVFERNSILPLVKTIYREVSRTIKKGSDDKIIINVLEGNSKAHPNTNQGIGVIEIKASQLQGDLIRGSDVEIKIEMSESRDVSVKVNLLLFNQHFSNVFSPTEKYISLQKLREEIKEIRNMLMREVEKAANGEDFEKAAEMQELSVKLQKLHEDAMGLKEDDLSDLKYQIEEQKRKLAQQIYGSENNPRIVQIKADYYHWREIMQYWCDKYSDMPQQHRDEFEVIKQKETAAFASNSFFQIDSLQKAQDRLAGKMIMYTPSLLVAHYHNCASLSDDEYTDINRARSVIASGERALDRKNYEELRSVLSQLYGLIRRSASVQKISGTGLG
ncbi:MAG: Hsp70 family protein [Bacteroidetes bacterium]|jgi:molecular chaperone DnaK|nr:Hsp70 family protein [Bacteroidota bacterium]